MTTKPKTKPKPIDLTALSQSEMAALVGKPTSWLRDRADLPGRNADGTYDAAAFIRGVRGDFVAGELPDGDLEPSIQLGDALADAYDTDRLRSVVRLIDRIESSHGAPGLAAVALAIRDSCRSILTDMGDHAFPPVKTADELRAEAALWVEKELDRQANSEAVAAGRIVFVCDTCRKYRWGRTWREPPLPPGFARRPHRCPECDK